MAKQVPIRETIKGASPTDQRLQEEKRKQQWHNTGIEYSIEIKSKGKNPFFRRLYSDPYTISDFKIAKI